MNIRKYSGCHPNWDLNDDGRSLKGYWIHSGNKSWCRYWTRQMLKKVYGLRVKYTEENLHGK